MKILNTTFLLLFVFFYSCNNNRIIDTHEALKDEKWSWSELKVYSFEVQNTNLYHTVSINLRINKDYEFSNLYVLGHIRNPEGKIETQRMNFILTDETGKWQGSGSGNYVYYTMPLFSNKTFSKPGIYEIAIEQNMRDSVLNYVANVGVRVEEGNPVF